MIEILNRDSPKIIELASGQNKSYVKICSYGKLYFTKGAVQQFGLTPGKYLHFINKDRKWFFFQNDDDKGFIVTQYNSERSAVAIWCAPLLLLMKKSGMKEGDRFSMNETGGMIGNSPVIEISKTYLK